MCWQTLETCLLFDGLYTAKSEKSIIMRRYTVHWEPAITDKNVCHLSLHTVLLVTASDFKKFVNSTALLDSYGNAYTVSVVIEIIYSCFSEMNIFRILHNINYIIKRGKGYMFQLVTLSDINYDFLSTRLRRYIIYLH